VRIPKTKWHENLFGKYTNTRICSDLHLLYSVHAKNADKRSGQALVSLVYAPTNHCLDYPLNREGGEVAA